jgi:isopentenyl diphosphate isomerase/L-lactate dehydrogenase-like FMN-dependent dehydrogenase
VLIGRPYVYALAVEGEAGVRRALALLKEETELALALLGCPKPAALGRQHVAS